MDITKKHPRTCRCVDVRELERLTLVVLHVFLIFVKQLRTHSFYRLGKGAFKPYPAQECSAKEQDYRNDRKNGKVKSDKEECDNGENGIQINGARIDYQCKKYISVAYRPITFRADVRDSERQLQPAKAGSKIRNPVMRDHKKFKEHGTPHN